jgi:hypothetical protein
MSISIDPDLGDQVRAAAERAGKPLSGWLAEAAAAKLRAEALADYLEDFVRRRGPLSPEEIRAARVELGLTHDRQP